MQAATTLDHDIPENGVQARDRPRDAEHPSLRQQEADIAQYFVKSLRDLPPSSGRSVYCNRFDNQSVGAT